MRRQEVCERRLTPFQLSVDLDGARLYQGEVRPSGSREDRPAYVFREFRVAPGSHRIAVRFEAERPAQGGAAGEPPRSPPLLLDETVELAPREILLVTSDPEADRLEIQRAGGAEAARF
jgi:hypothetical protein